MIRFTIHTKNPFVSILFLLVLITCKTASASEKQLPSAKTQLVNTVHIYGNNVVYPMTAWQKSAVIESMNKNKGGNELPFKIRRFQDGNLFTIMMVPANESFNNWKNFYAIFGIQIPCQWRVDLDSIVSTMKPPSKACKKVKITRNTLQKNNHRALVVTEFCEATNPAHPGGISIDYFALMPNNTYINVRQVWRGKNLKITDPKSWPISEKTLSAAQKNIAQVKIHPTTPACPKGAKKRADLPTSLISEINHTKLSSAEIVRS